MIKWWFALLLLTWQVQANQRVVMTSLNWPPYSGEELIEQGVSVAIAKEAFAAMGYQLVVEFKPWVRTVTTASRKAQYIGYFPEYYFDTQEFVFSDPIGHGPLGLVENTQSPIRWSTLSDLTQYRVGTVKGYVNTPEFDQMVASGSLTVEETLDDLRNVYKVAKGRLDAAVIDANVLDFLIRRDSRSALLSKRLRMNPTLLAEKDLFLAFNNSEEGRKWRDIFNQGLAKIDPLAIAASVQKRQQEPGNVTQLPVADKR